MANASISGLASGLDTRSIVSQLMQIEALPQGRLQIQMADEKTNVSSLQDLNAKLKALVAEAGKLAAPTGWSPVKATTSDPHVTVTGASGATATSLGISVTSLAQSHQVRFASATATDTVAASSIKLDFADAALSDVTLNLTNQTLDGVVAALNGSGTGVHASKVDVGGGQYRLLVSSAATGAASQFTLTNGDGTNFAVGAGDVVVAGADAAFTVGGIPVTSASNTVTAVSGLTINLGPGTPLDTPIAITVETDTTALKTAMKSLVEHANAALTQMDDLTTYDAATKTKGALYANAQVRESRNALAQTIFPGDGTSMSGVGIQIDREGKITFDEAAFDKAYAADPVAVRDKFVSGPVDGFAARVEAAADAMSDSVDGTVTMAVKSHSATIEEMQDRIDGWDVRLDLRRSMLNRQFSALETALGQLQAQGNWLSGQLSSLSSSS